MASKAALAPYSAVKLSSSSTIPLENVAFKTRKALAEQSPTNLFRAPANIIRSWKGRMSGAHEWQTSTYCYNKNTQKTMPAASRVADKLLRDYMTMIRGTGAESTGASSTARNAVALRRKDTAKMYVSETSVKDFGDKVVINAYVYDGVHAAEEERLARQAARKSATPARKPPVRGPGGARRPPMTARRPMGAPRLPVRTRLPGTSRPPVVSRPPGTARPPQAPRPEDFKAHTSPVPGLIRRVGGPRLQTRTPSDKPRPTAG